MDGHHCSSELDSCEPEEFGIAQSPPSSGSSGGTGTKASRRHLTAADSSASSPPAKRSRRSVQKRVVTIPISETKGGAGEGAPPSDSWAWRKYGQKPIKGSPYPRGYYRCSSSKGCPARKQVERSRVDPSTIVVTYSFDHNHPWLISKNNHHQKAPVDAPEAEPEPVEEQLPLLSLQRQEQLPQQHAKTTDSSPPESADRDEKFSDLIGDEESSLLIPDGGFNWLGDVGTPVSTSPAGSDELLYGSVFFGGPSETVITGFPAEETEESTSGAAAGCEDDALFAGLGELPEYSVVFRRGALASAAWMGTTNG